MTSMQRLAALALSIAVWAGLAGGSSPAPASALLHPKVRAAEIRVARLAELRSDFADPPAEYRPMPLWVWNDQMSWPRIQEQLRQFKQQGMGGVFVHPRPGLMTEYLGADWFRLWKMTLEEGKRLGLLVNIYDENSFPAGFAGGAVPAVRPDTVSQYVEAELDADRDILRWREKTISCFAAEKTADGEVRSVRRVRSAAEIPPGHSLLTFRLRRASGNAWTAGHPYVDLTNPETVPAFLEITYEPYHHHFGPEFGKAVRWSFADEPLLATAGAYENSKLGLVLSHYALAEFQKRRGYDLAEQLPSLYWDVGDFRKVRFDYWQTLHDLWKENYFGPMFDWCERHGLQFTGHLMEDTWPEPWISPDDASMYAFMHMPGIDMIPFESVLRETGQDSHLLFTIKQLASVAHQLGRRALAETYGVSGWDCTFEQFKRFGDWVLVHGVSFVNEHLAFSTIRGARKRDNPQSFSDAAAWWPQYRPHADYLARVAQISSRTEARNRILILEQTTSAFLVARRGAPAPELDRIRARNGEMNQFLADHQVDYDLGDEYMIEWFGRQEGRRFAIGKAAYDLLVIPPDMDNLRSQTIPHLEQFLAAGGAVLALSDPPAYVDGRSSTRVPELARRYSGQWLRMAGLPELLSGIHQRLRPRIVFASELPTSIGFSQRFLAGGERVLFLANSGLKAVRTHAAAAGASMEEWDPASGQIAPARYSAAGGTLTFAVDLPPTASRLLLVKDAPGEPDATPEPVFTPLPSGEWSVRADAPNVLALDYCDWKTDKTAFESMNTWLANWTVWQYHGFERPAWDNATQFGQRVFERNHFSEESGFEATYHFEMADVAALRGLALAVESPELYRVELNGHPVDFRTGVRWLDPHILSVSVEEFAHAGENVVRLVAHPFDVRMEIENVYLLGAFNAEPTGRGYRLQSPTELKFGPWKDQGYAFYGDAVTYQTELSLPAGSRRVRVGLGEWQGSVAVVLLDGKQVGQVGWRPFRAEFAATPGKHRLAVRVISTPRNVLGPFHDPSKPRMNGKADVWSNFPEHQPAGAAYDLLDYGLVAPPGMRASR